MPSSLHNGAAAHTPLALLAPPNWDFNLQPGYLSSHFLKDVRGIEVRMGEYRDFSLEDPNFYAIDDKAIVPEQAYRTRMLDTNVLALSVAVTPFGMYSRPVENEDKNSRKKKPILWQYDGNIADWVMTTGLHEAVVFHGVFDTKAKRPLEAMIYPHATIEVKQRYLAGVEHYGSLGQEIEDTTPEPRRGVLYLNRHEARELCSHLHLSIPHHIIEVTHDFVYSALGTFFAQQHAPAIFSSYNPSTGHLSYSTTAVVPQARGTAGMRTNSHCNNIHLLGSMYEGKDLEQSVSERIVTGLSQGGKDPFKYALKDAKKALKVKPAEMPVAA